MINKEAQAMRWWDYRIARSNAIWFSKQTPMTTATHKHINAITGEYETAITTCTAKDLKTNTEKWITDATGKWQNLLKERHPDALLAVESHTSTLTKTAEKNTSANTVNSLGLPDGCLCPDCMMDEIKRVQNHDLGLTL